MEFNNLILCIFLWVSVDILTFIVTLLHKKSVRMHVTVKEQYIQRILYFLSKNTPIDDVLKEVLLSIKNTKGYNKYLRKIVFSALKYHDIQKGFKYIETKIGCAPVNEIHRYLMKNYSRIQDEMVIDKKVLYRLKKEADLWKTNRSIVDKVLKKNRLKYIIEKIILFIINLALYLHLKTDLSLCIFIVVNTISVILFIVLDYESIIVDEKKRDGKLANNKKSPGVRKKTHLPAFRLKGIFQLVAGMGLILNISTIAVQFLEQAV